MHTIKHGATQLTLGVASLALACRPPPNVPNSALDKAYAAALADDAQPLAAVLRNGEILCRVVNVIAPGSVARVNIGTTIAFKQTVGVRVAERTRAPHIAGPLRLTPISCACVRVRSRHA